MKKPVTSVKGDNRINSEDESEDTIERTRFIEALEETKYQGTGRWNLTATAQKLDSPRKTFTYRLKRLGISQ